MTKLFKNLLIVNIFYNLYKIVCSCTKIQTDLEKKKSLELNAYDVRIDENFVKNDDLIDTFLLDSQCAILLIDIMNKKSFDLIKDLYISIPNKNKFLKKILVLNKNDLETSRIVTDYEIQEYVKDKKDLDLITISIKTGENLNQLIDKIYNAVNDTQSEFPLNIVSISLGKKLNLLSSQSTLTFILIGDSDVGKTSLAGRYFKNQYGEEFISTIGINKEIKTVKIANEVIRINLWDTAGQERFNNALPKTYYQNADGVLLLFDVNNEESFNNIQKRWMNDITENSTKKVKGENGKNPEISLFLIGNKIDKLERVIPKERAEQMAQSLGMKYFEISCKINLNIEEVMARMVIDCFMRERKIDSVLRLTTRKIEEEKGCCGGSEKKKDKK